MSKKTAFINTLTQVTFYTGLAASLYALVSSYLIKKDLPAGVCPISTNQNIYFIAIGLLVISLVGSFVVSYQKSKSL